jgi:tRNA(fMet)-specific endonuclease VapC
MPTYLLDTDTLSLFQRDHPRVLLQVAAHAVDLLAICTVTVEEQISGWSSLARSARTPQQHEFASQFLAELVPTWNRFTVLPMTVAALAVFDQLVRSKLNVKRNDLRIAAIALDLGATIATRNARDFGRVPGLVIEDWSV